MLQRHKIPNNQPSTHYFQEMSAATSLCKQTTLSTSETFPYFTLQVASDDEVLLESDPQQVISLNSWQRLKQQMLVCFKKNLKEEKKKTA